MVDTGDNQPYSYEQVQEIAQFLLDRTKTRPKIAIICGTGLGDLIESVTQRQIFPYEDIPGFPVSTVVGHAGKLVFGVLNGVQVMCMQGRFHPFEGYPVWKCAMPVRVMKLCGITHLIVTNAAGGISEHLDVGDLMIIKDHINLLGFSGKNPLIGPNDERFGPRFPATVKCYDRGIRKKVMSIAKEMGITEIIKEGVYTAQGGPAFETVAETRCLKALGTDAVGMSTVHEVVTARHCGLTVFGMSLITNRCALSYDQEDEVTHEAVLEVSNSRAKLLQQLICRLVPLVLQE
ncbi:purine nucleoside phosphorylase-like [Schistocerca gregaria]|uniref:purine nucleoside phosphorylase-like n=1 Tax=Schistocerca gregaria TaxID=7010 RepID=UPI00211DCA79|nr:purine nucleoside phosphorylase-like [Schistocerca gregaria]